STRAERVDGLLPGPKGQAFSIEEDDAGRVWASTLQETFRVDPKTRAVDSFGAGRGLPAGLVVPARLRDGLVFGTKAGLFRFDESASRFVADRRFDGKWISRDDDLYRIVEAPDGGVYLRAADKTLHAAARGN